MSLAERAARRAENEPTLARPAWSLADLSESRRWAYYLLLPSLLLVAAVAIYPVASGVWLSFQRYNLLRAPVPTFIGLVQYADLAGDPIFWTSVRNTVVWVTVGAGSQFLLGLITALALNRPGVRGLGFLRVGLLLPWLMPTVVAGHMWSLLLDSRLGVVNDVLVRMGLVHGYVAWFAQAETAMWSVLTVDLWKNFPFFTLLLLAGLQGVPDELYEAAEVDGAGAWYRFLRITLPLLTPVIVGGHFASDRPGQLARPDDHPDAWRARTCYARAVSARLQRCLYGVQFRRCRGSGYGDVGLADAVHVCLRPSLGRCARLSDARCSVPDVKPSACTTWLRTRSCSVRSRLRSFRSSGRCSRHSNPTRTSSLLRSSTYRCARRFRTTPRCGRKLVSR
jgi:multiple sugar transport system permease protein